MLNFIIAIIIFITTGIGLIAFFFLENIFGKLKELIYQNRLLSGLRKLDDVVFSSTDLKTVCQGIVNTTRIELGYTFGAIALVDEKIGGIRRIAISNDPKMDAVLKELPIEYEQQVVPLTMTDNFLVKAVLEKKMVHTTDLYDVQKGIFPKETSRNIQNFLNFKSLYIYPLISTNTVIGIIYYSSQEKLEKVSRFEADIMKDFSTESARILENVLLYQKLKDTSSLLLEANQKLTELDRLKDDFVSVVSHELRTPMTAIKSYAWMALHKSETPLSENVEKYLIRVLMSAERLIRLVNDLLNISSIESGKMEINLEPVDLYSLCKDIIDEVYYSRSTEKKIEFAISEKTIPKVLADPEKLRQVFLNLTDNALKFTPVGGKITFDFLFDNSVVQASITDTGVGIAAKDIERLFQKFGKLDNSYVGAAISQGTGLGLYLTKSLVEQMHGKIQAFSKGLNQGATFTVSLPAAK